MPGPHVDQLAAVAGANQTLIVEETSRSPVAFRSTVASAVPALDPGTEH